MSQGIHISGLSEIKARLESLGLRVEKRVIRKGLRQGAKIVLGAARAEAPERSGTVLRNIKIRAGRGSKGVISLTVGAAAKDFKGPAFYAGFLIYGHHVGSRKLGDKRKFVPANNFLQRAYDGTKEAAAERTAAAWVELIDQEVKPQ
jgi:HK97 gp10 family phage protein